MVVLIKQPVSHSAHTSYGRGQYILQARLNVGDILQLPRNEPVTVVHLKVVAIRPLSTSTIAVIGVVPDGKVVLGCPIKVREADHLVQLRQSSDGDIADNVGEASVGGLEEGPSSVNARESSRCDGEELGNHFA